MNFHDFGIAVGKEVKLGATSIKYPTNLTLPVERHPTASGLNDEPYENVESRVIHVVFA